MTLAEFIAQFFTFDNIVRTLTIISGIIGFIVYIHKEITRLRSDVAAIKEHQKLLMDAIKQLNNILTQIAVQEARLNMIEKDIDEIRHGKGFIS